ncbi:hypothetical protein LINPERHAP1_LOCUS42106 [Linum perenne]
MWGLLSALVLYAMRCLPGAP